jgi:hypothetical protein
MIDQELSNDNHDLRYMPVWKPIISVLKSDSFRLNTEEILIAVSEMDLQYKTWQISWWKSANDLSKLSEIYLL